MYRVLPFRIRIYILGWFNWECDCHNDLYFRFYEDQCRKLWLFKNVEIK